MIVSQSSFLEEVALLQEREKQDCMQLSGGSSLFIFIQFHEGVQKDLNLFPPPWRSKLWVTAVISTLRAVSEENRLNCLLQQEDGVTLLNASFQMSSIEHSFFSFNSGLELKMYVC